MAMVVCRTRADLIRRISIESAVMLQLYDRAVNYAPNTGDCSGLVGMYVSVRRIGFAAYISVWFCFNIIAEDMGTNPCSKINDTDSFAIPLLDAFFSSTNPATGTRYVPSRDVYKRPSESRWPASLVSKPCIKGWQLREKYGISTSGHLRARTSEDQGAYFCDLINVRVLPRSEFIRTEPW